MPSKPATVLLVASGWVHPSWLARMSLAWTLSALPRYRFHRMASLEDLPDTVTDHYAAIVLYIHRQHISAAALERLENFVCQGGGLLAVHSASASFKHEKRFTQLLGGQFVGHGPVQRFTVQPSVEQDPVFGRLEAFQVRDELYRHEWDPGNRIHFFTTVADSEMPEPVVWTRSFGMGRVCYCSLGHRAAVLRHPAVSTVLGRGLIWVCTADTREPA